MWYICLFSIIEEACYFRCSLQCKNDGLCGAHFHLSVTWCQCLTCSPDILRFCVAKVVRQFWFLLKLVKIRQGYGTSSKVLHMVLYACQPKKCFRQMLQIKTHPIHFFLCIWAFFEVRK
jgi:hypothetical protein